MLSQPDLAAALKDLLATDQPTAAAAADAMASAYYDYASAGMVGASSLQLLPASRAAMAATIMGAIALPVSGSPSAISAAWAAGVSAFWLGVPVVGVQSGATSGCPGAGALTAALTAIFANVANTPDTCAQGMAAALHAATLTVAATVAPPAGTVLTVL